MKERFQKEWDDAMAGGNMRRAFLRLVNGLKHRLFPKRTIFLNRNPEYKNWNIGDYSYGSRTGSPRIVHYGEPFKLSIGKFCCFADHVTLFLGGNHRIDWVTTYPFSVFFEEASEIEGHPISKGDISIGNDVWVGEGASILSGVRIGDGAVVAAHSVVVSDVPAYAVVGGNPAKVLKMRFDEQTIFDLQSISWWNWEIRKVIDNAELLLQDDIRKFIGEHIKTVSG